MISQLFINICLITLITAATIKPNSHSLYDVQRNYILEAEDLLATGGSLHLTNRESKADAVFMKYKMDELDKSFNNPEIANTAGMHFFKAKPLIDKSKVYEFLKRMPKGANLHAHTTATVSSEWVVKNIFYMPELLRCNTTEGVSILTFRQHSQHGCITDYVRVTEERRLAHSVADYDESLETLINLYTPTPELSYPSINTVWKKFQNMFKTLADALLFLPAFRLYYTQMLEELYNDNVMYTEVRLNFYQLYNITGHQYPIERTVTELIDVVDVFKLQHPNFLGIKVIYSVGRKAESDVIRQKLENFKKLYSSFPNFLIGFDLVGQEDRGKPLYNFIDVLNDEEKSYKFFFHAGETKWFGTSTDYNMIDAVLLNTTRIGHGYALMKHPALWNAVKTRDIAIEVSPISNQVLNLVQDLRNHPATFFISQNIPIVICNDDPGFWNAKALSYDFYYAVMSLAPYNSGLKLLKQLVWNSIKYSTLEASEQQEAYALLQSQWDSFIDDVISGNVV